MNLSQVYTALKFLNKGRLHIINSQTAQFMQEKGLITILDPTQYRRMQSDASRLNYLNKDIKSYRCQVEHYQTQIVTLTDKLNSDWHKFWSRQATLDRKQRNLDDAKIKFKTLNQKLSNSQSKKERLEGVKQDLKSYVRTFESYVKPTDKSSFLFSRMKARLYRLGECAYDEFETEITKLEEDIINRAERLSVVYDKLAEIYGQSYPMTSAAQIIASYEGKVDDIIERFKEASTSLDEISWTDAKQLPIAAEIMGIKDQPLEELVRKLNKIDSALTEKGYDNNYETGNAALVILKSSKNKDVATLVEGMDNTWELMKNKYGWGSSSINNTVAARFSLMGEPKKVVDKVEQIYQELVKQEWPESLDTALLASVLINSGLTPSAVAERADKVYGAMKNNGWSMSTDYNIPVGILTILPGTPEEVVDNADMAYYALKKEGFPENRVLTQLATGLLVDFYINIQNEGFFRSIASQMNLPLSSATPLNISLGLNLKL